MFENLSVQIVRPCVARLNEEKKRKMKKKMKREKKKCKLEIDKLLFGFCHPRGFCENVYLRIVAIGVLVFLSLNEYFKCEKEEEIL